MIMYDLANMKGTNIFMKIAIEGMDGVGKTTIAKQLSERNGYEYIGNAIHQLFKIKDKNNPHYHFFQAIEDEIFLRSGNDILRAWLCSLGNIYTATQSEYKDFIVDRHLLSNFQQNGTKENVQIYKTLVELIGTPDMSIILYASPETRLKRIWERDKGDKDLHDEAIKKDEYSRMIKFAEKFNMPYLVIDTEGKSIEQIIQEIEEKVDFKERKGKENEQR